MEARTNTEYTPKAVQFASQVKHWDDAKLNTTTRHKLNALRASITLPSPNNEALATELAHIGSKVQSMYG